MVVGIESYIGRRAGEVKRQAGRKRSCPRPILSPPSSLLPPPFPPLRREGGVGEEGKGEGREGGGEGREGRRLLPLLLTFYLFLPHCCLLMGTRPSSSPPSPP